MRDLYGFQKKSVRGPREQKSEAVRIEDGVTRVHVNMESYDSLDKVLIKALHDEETRNQLMTLETKFLQLLEQPQINKLKLTKEMKPYMRLLVHRVSDYYGLERIVEKSRGEESASISVCKNHLSRKPPVTLHAFWEKRCSEANEENDQDQNVRAMPKNLRLMSRPSAQSPEPSDTPPETPVPDRPVVMARSPPKKNGQDYSAPFTTMGVMAPKAGPKTESGVSTLKCMKPTTKKKPKRPMSMVPMIPEEDEDDAFFREFEERVEEPRPHKVVPAPSFTILKREVPVEVPPPVAVPEKTQEELSEKQKRYNEIKERLGLPTDEDEFGRRAHHKNVVSEDLVNDPAYKRGGGALAPGAQQEVPKFPSHNYYGSCADQEKEGGPLITQMRKNAKIFRAQNKGCHLIKGRGKGRGSLFLQIYENGQNKVNKHHAQNNGIHHTRKGGWHKPHHQPQYPLQQQQQHPHPHQHQLQHQHPHPHQIQHQLQHQHQHQQHQQHQQQQQHQPHQQQHQPHQPQQAHYQQQGRGGKAKGRWGGSGKRHEEEKARPREHNYGKGQERGYNMGYNTGYTDYHTDYNMAYNAMPNPQMYSEPTESFTEMHESGEHCQQMVPNMMPVNGIMRSVYMMDGGQGNTMPHVLVPLPMSHTQMNMNYMVPQMMSQNQGYTGYGSGPMWMAPCDTQETRHC